MPQVEPEIAKARAARLRDTAARRRTAWLHSLVGTTQSILVERPGDRGHAGNFADVRFANSFALSLSKGVGDKRASTSSARPVGEIVAAKITGVADGALIGTIA
jgi:threonylcarbamoyladenosine tRNA methylthiotransferase MtaB